nr:tripartite tricarboxylate transporter TctB family protein [Notoacmeibacter sp. MSK16QG-6]
MGLTAAGSAAAIYAAAHYSVGTVTRMGPGMMPVSLGVILAAFGLAIAAPAFFRRGETVPLNLRPLIVLTIAILTFALMIEPVGLIAAVFSTTVIATLAESRVSLGKALILGAAMSLLTWTIFIAGLGLPIRSFGWPF